MNEIILCIWVVCALWLLLKLNWWAVVLCVAMAVVLILFLQKGKKEGQYQKRRLQDTANYLEQVLVTFGREGKIDVALEQTKATFLDGDMKETLQEAETVMSLSMSEDVYRDGLDVIYQKYPCERVRKVNEFMLHAEYYGGDMEESIRLLLADVKNWKRRCEWAIEDRKTGYRNVIMSVIMSVLICSMILHLPMMEIDISSMLPVQIMSVVVLLLDTIILISAQRFLCVDWLRLDEDGKGRNYGEELEEYRQYDGRKERKLSVILAGISGGATIILLVMKKYGGALFLAAVGVFFLNQHELGHRLKGRRILRQIQRDFPVWMLDLVLLLQGENVQTAIQKSKYHAPPVLEKDIEQLTARLEMDPESFEPYSGFLPDFLLPEIQSALRILFSISMGNTGSRDHRMEDLIASNNEMLENAQREWLKDRNSGLYLLFLAPVMTASMKLLTDMTMFMMSFLTAGYM